MSKLGGKLTILEQLIPGQLERVHCEVLGLALETLRVEGEGAPFLINLAANNLLIFVELEIFLNTVDHDILFFNICK